MVAVGPAGIGRAPGLGDRKPGQAEREDVGQQVAGVRQQRQGVGDAGSDGLEGQDPGRHQKRRGQHAAGGVLVMMPVLDHPARYVTSRRFRQRRICVPYP